MYVRVCVQTKLRECAVLDGMKAIATGALEERGGYYVLVCCPFFCIRCSPMCVVGCDIWIMIVHAGYVLFCTAMHDLSTYHQSAFVLVLFFIRFPSFLFVCTHTHAHTHQTPVKVELHRSLVPFRVAPEGARDSLEEIKPVLSVWKVR